MPKVSFRMASASRESVFGEQTNTARKIHRSDHTEGRLTTAPSGCCVRKGTAIGTSTARSHCLRVHDRHRSAGDRSLAPVSGDRSVVLGTTAGLCSPARYGFRLQARSTGSHSSEVALLKSAERSRMVTTDGPGLSRPGLEGNQSEAVAAHVGLEGRWVRSGGEEDRPGTGWD